jgi:hypothetical protein
MTGEERKLHNEELRELYSSPSINRIIKSRRMRWARHAAEQNPEAYENKYIKNPTHLKMAM